MNSNNYIYSLSIVFTFMVPTISFATPDLPLIQRGHFVHQGAFRVPSGMLGTVSKANPSFGTEGGRALSFNPINNSLYMMGNKFEVLLAELNIPSTIVKSSSRNSLTTATIRQNPLDITSGLGCFIGPIQNDPAIYGYGIPTSKCSAEDFADKNTVITLSALSGSNITVTRNSGTWDTLKVKVGFKLVEPNGGYGAVTSVSSSTLIVKSILNFNHAVMTNSDAIPYPGWVLYNLGGNNLSSGGVLLGGTLVDAANNKLVGTTYTTYDGEGNTTFSHFTANLNWTPSVNAKGMYRVGSTINDNNGLSAGFVDGYMGWIPSEWQSDFGKKALTGMGAMAIISRTSYGPSLFAFNPADLGNGTLGTNNDPVSATPLVYYPSTHQTLGTYDSNISNPVYNISTELRGVVFPSGTRSVLFFGRTGMGSPCYGAGSIYASQAVSNADMAEWIISNNTQAAFDFCNVPVNNTRAKIASCIVGTPSSKSYTCGSVQMDAAGNDACCFDAANGDKGIHTYPYVYYVWAYDALDLLKVKNGTTNPATGLAYKPWELTPYAQWDLGSDIGIFGPPGNDNVVGHGDNKILGAAYDPSTQRIYLSQANGDDGLPLIHVYSVNSLAATISPVQNLRIGK